ncbi:MAG: stage II sporulation protein M [Candidatus Nanoarchaeia archaeon]|nr:stage II sporulation protein M [Candidatus Nanoarchaeia archaeon]MDD5741744.1 stage II sporulation protein M [Candidatus Nanoarchaeia archaeon]
MLEMLVNPKKAERSPWEMFFIGAFYATVSLLLVKWIFSSDPVLSKYTGIIVVTFCVMFSIPFIYYTFKLEEEKDLQITGFKRLLVEHDKALFAFMFLFMGFIVAFSFWYIVFPSGNQNFRAQIETYCMINKPSHFDECVSEYGIEHVSKTTAFLTAKEKIVNIFANNIYVLIFTLVFSLIFGAGAIFILAWNASVISAAIGIFSKDNLITLPLGLARYMIHGIPEIGAYFAGALAGGIISIAVIKHDVHSEKFWIILQDSLNLVIISVVLLFVAALIEVFITPAIF